MWMALLSSKEAPPLWLPIAIFIGSTLLVTRGIAWIGGWATLARRFASTTPCMGPQWRLQSLRLRFSVAYNNCVTVGAAADGLHLSMPAWLFFMGHASLVIPWHEIALIEVKRAWYGDWTKYVVGAEERIPMTIPARLADRIEQARRENFPIR